MPNSSPSKPSSSTAAAGYKKRKSSEPLEDDRFSSFLSTTTNAAAEEGPSAFPAQGEEEEDTTELDKLSSFPRQPLPNHLLPKHLANASSSSSSTTSTKKVKQPGLIYLSRIPPGMGPGKVKHLLGQFGEVGRIYLARADANKEVSSAKKYKQKERHQSHNFKEGWIEFLDKRVARSVAEMLNAQTIGGNGPKSSKNRWYDDVWTMKYLPRFRWDQLSEQVALERATQTSLMRFHLNHSKQEQESYLSAVEKARVTSRIEEKAASRSKNKSTATSTEKDSGEGGEGSGAAKESKNAKRKREYRQRQVVDGDKKGVEEGKGGDRKGSKQDLENVLGRLF
ncbi:hypothetical protein JCM16303_006549 [Sporobolomyces ruberrimus]